MASSLIVKEGFMVDEAIVKSVHAQRPPKLEVKASALNDVLPVPHVNGKHLITEGISGLLRICNVKSTCQVSTITHGTGQPTPAAASITCVGSTNLDPRCRRLVRTVSRGLRAAQEPEAAKDGLGGTYFLMNESGKPAALMKPCDEEPLAPNNPKGFVGRQLGDPGMKPSVRVGEAAIREVAAYLLDHDHRAKVPATVLVRASHPVFHVAQPLSDLDVPNTPNNTPSTPCPPENPSSGAVNGGLPKLQTQLVPSKLGSLQEYTSHMCDSSEVGASRFNAKNIHLIGILDLRLFNTDRHAGNLLVRRPQTGSQGRLGVGAMIMESNQLELIPIDHGFCLPDSLEAPYFEWLHWPQAMLPFDDDELEYIAELDPDGDVEMLRKHLPMLRSDCLRMLWLSTFTLQRCAAAGLTLSEIGTVYSRPLVGLDEEPSELERVVRAAWQHVLDVRNGGACYEDLQEEDELEGFDEEDEYDGEEEDESEEEEEEEEKKRQQQQQQQWGVSDSASSHLSSSQCKGSSSPSPKAAAASASLVRSPSSLAGKPAEVEEAQLEFHDSPRSNCGILLGVSVPSPPGSMGDLQFQLQLEESDCGGGLTPRAGSAGAYGGLDSIDYAGCKDPSLAGEADSWSLAAFSMASLSVAGSVIGGGGPDDSSAGGAGLREPLQQRRGRHERSLSSSDEELLEQAYSLCPASALSAWRRHQNVPDGGKAKALHSLTPSHVRRTRQRARHHGAGAPGCSSRTWQPFKEAGAEPGRLGELQDSEWEVFQEGFCGHLDAALQAGLWKAANQAGAAAARNVFGSSAPC